MSSLDQAMEESSPRVTPRTRAEEEEGEEEEEIQKGGVVRGVAFADEPEPECERPRRVGFAQDAVDPDKEGQAAEARPRHAVSVGFVTDYKDVDGFLHDELSSGDGEDLDTSHWTDNPVAPEVGVDDLEVEAANGHHANGVAAPAAVSAVSDAVRSTSRRPRKALSGRLKVVQMEAAPGQR
jgi:hypothetical protein